MKYGINGLGLGEIFKGLRWGFRVVDKYSWYGSIGRYKVRLYRFINIWECGWFVVKAKKIYKKICRYIIIIVI